MCSMCGAINGHLSGCPEAPERAEIIGECEWCGERITSEDDEYYRDEEGNMYHADCIEQYAVDILEERFGIKRKRI